MTLSWSDISLAIDSVAMKPNLDSALVQETSGLGRKAGVGGSLKFGSSIS